MTLEQKLAVLPSRHTSDVPNRSPGRRLVGWALGEASDAVPWLLVGAAFLYLAFLLGRFGHILSAVNWSSDAAFWPMLAEHLPETGTGFTNLGNTPHYMTILFLAATKAIPGHRAIWAVTPLLTSLAGVALIAWAARRAFGRQAGLLTLCVGACASFPVIQTIVPQGVRSWTWVADALTGALLVLLTSIFLDDQPRRSTRARGAIAALAATAFAGLTLASDPLFMASALGPFVVATGVVWLRHPTRGSRRLALAAGAAVAGSLAIAPVVAWAAGNLGFRWTPLPNAFAFPPYDQLLRNLGFLGEALLALGNGLFFGRALDLVALAMVVSGGIGLVAITTTLTRAARRLTGAGEATARWTPVRTAHVTYWTLSAVFVAAVFVLSTIPAGGLASSRYLIPVFYAVAALLPLCAEGPARSRMTVAAAAVVFCLVGIFSQDLLVAYDRGPFSRPRDGRKVIAFLENEGLTRGYAGYWDSHSLTWHSHGRATLYPVFECQQPSRALCPFNLAVNTAWYHPERSLRTFIVAGPANPPPALRSPPSDELGTPIKTATLGDYSVFVYDYDVASRFAPMPPPP